MPKIREEKGNKDRYKKPVRGVVEIMVTQLPTAINRPEKIPIDSFDPAKHCLLGNSVIVSFRITDLRRMTALTKVAIYNAGIGCCDFRTLEGHAGENIPAVNPGPDVQVVMLGAPFNCWFPKIHLAIMEPPEYKEEAA